MQPYQKPSVYIAVAAGIVCGLLVLIGMYFFVANLLAASVALLAIGVAILLATPCLREQNREQ